jgi:hypothetical protein
MITCPNCGTANESQAAFCGNCGKSLAASPAPEPAAPTPPAAAALAAPPRPVAPIQVTCPNCGSPNNPDRTFCWKCAAELHPGPPPKAPSPFDRQFFYTFALSAVVGLAVIVGGSFLLRPPAPPSTAITITPPNADPVALALQQGKPQPLPVLPTDQHIQLAAYTQAAASSTPPDYSKGAPWWNSQVPRIPAVSQFDGGPLAKVNCVMASGAMLARLAFGIVTTGSQLRGLQDDQQQATNYNDLGVAVGRGWGVKFFKGDLTAIQLRSLLWAGAGAVIGVVYGDIPVDVRLQESFTGNHSIYIDAFRPDGPDGPAAYYVMDPIGHTWAGYKGGWWPASDVERAAYAHSGGVISATWAFAGGVVPANHPILPRQYYPRPSANPSAAPTFAPSLSPTESGAPDQMPTGDTPLAADPGIGDPPPDIPSFVIPDFVTNLYIPDPNPTVQLCAVVPAPAGCPDGVPAIAIFGSGSGIAVASPEPSLVNFLYVNPIAIGQYQVFFTAPPDTQQSLFLWGSTGGALQQQPVEQTIINGSPVSMSTITVDPTGNFSFVATANGAGTSASSTVGSLVLP